MVDLRAQLLPAQADFAAREVATWSWGEYLPDGKKPPRGAASELDMEAEGTARFSHLVPIHLYLMVEPVRDSCQASAPPNPSPLNPIFAS